MGVVTKVVDSQIHLWLAEASDRPWPDYGRSYAHGQQFTAEQALTLMDEANVNAAILVPPSWEGDRNDYCLDAAVAQLDRFAVMGRFPVDDPSRADELDSWLNTPGMIGIRLTFHNDVQKHWLRAGTVDWFWQCAERNDIPLMIFAPSQLPSVKKIASQHPNLRIVIDHLGVIGGQGLPLLPRISALLDMAECENVAVKASCLPSLVAEAYPFPSLQPIIEHVVDVFGVERVFWGSDVSRLPCTPAENVRLFTEACTFLSPSETEWIMGKGICNWLSWSEGAS